VVRISSVPPSVGEATIDLRQGERLTVRELALGAMLPSANDAAYALAEHVGAGGGVRRFVRLMNARAEELGLADTTFRRPDGLDTQGHLSSARDVFELARAAMANRVFRRIAGTRRAQISGGRTLVNRNDLLFSYSGTFGVKTGQTSGAGWCEVIAARRDGVTLYAVVLGSPSRQQRNADLVELLDWGFDEFGRTVVISGDRAYAEARVPYREERTLRLVAREPATVIVRWGRPLIERVVAPVMVALPVRAGQELGQIQVLDGERVIASRPLIATESIPVPGLGVRIGWYADRALGHAGDLFGSILGAIF
jgi:D-alanyl-D-alanine carboxypeptidase (penicillin-binding protein 5/6)